MRTDNDLMTRKSGILKEFLALRLDDDNGHELEQ